MVKIPKRLIIGLLFFSLIGFADASYLTSKHYSGESLTCAIFDGCNEVTASVYSTVADVPISLLGAIYYLAIFFLAILFLDMKNNRVLKVLAAVSLAGFLVSLFLVYLQIFILEAICVYCMVSAVSSTTLFVLSLFGVKLINKQLINN